MAAQRLFCVTCRVLSASFSFWVRYGWCWEFFILWKKWLKIVKNACSCSCICLLKSNIVKHVKPVCIMTCFFFQINPLHRFTSSSVLGSFTAPWPVYPLKEPHAFLILNKSVHKNSALMQWGFCLWQLVIQSSSGGSDTETFTAFKFLWKLFIVWRQQSSFLC